MINISIIQGQMFILCHFSQILNCDYKYKVIQGLDMYIYQIPPFYFLEKVLGFSKDFLSSILLYCQ